MSWIVIESGSNDEGPIRPHVYGPFATRWGAAHQARNRVRELKDADGPVWNVIQSYTELLGTGGYNPLDYEGEWDLQQEELGWETTLTIHEIGEVN